MLRWIERSAWPDSLVGPASMTPDVLPLPAHGVGAFAEGGCACSGRISGSVRPAYPPSAFMRRSFRALRLLALRDGPACPSYSRFQRTRSACTHATIEPFGPQGGGAAKRASDEPGSSPCRAGGCRCRCCSPGPARYGVLPGPFPHGRVRRGIGGGPRVCRSHARQIPGVDPRLRAGCVDRSLM